MLSVSLLLQATIAFGSFANEQPQMTHCPHGTVVFDTEECPPHPYSPHVIFFGWDQAVLTGESRQTLDAVTHGRCGVEGRDDFSWLVEVHSDRSGSSAYNVRLSMRRAASVREYMVGRGCRPEAIKFMIAGEDRPPIATPDGVQELDNRRAVVHPLVPQNE